MIAVVAVVVAVCLTLCVYPCRTQAGNLTYYAAESSTPLKRLKIAGSLLRLSESRPMFGNPKYFLTLQNPSWAHELQLYSEDELERSQWVAEFVRAGVRFTPL